MNQSYKINYRNHEYLVCINKDNVIEYIFTSDSTFITEEGVRTGTQFSKLKKTNYQIKKDQGWSKYVILPSGWNAIIEKDCHKDSIVTCFFKRY